MNTHAILSDLRRRVFDASYTKAVFDAYEKAAAEGIYDVQERDYTAAIPALNAALTTGQQAILAHKEALYSENSCMQQNTPFTAA